jgi:hypothetical protein
MGPEIQVPKLMPFWVGELLIRQPLVSVSVTPMVPLLVTASACGAVTTGSKAPAHIKRRFLFIYPPPEDVSVRFPNFIYTAQHVSPAKYAAKGVIENLVYGYYFNHPCYICCIDKKFTLNTIRYNDLKKIFFPESEYTHENVIYFTIYRRNSDNKFNKN